MYIDSSDSTTGMHCDCYGLLHPCLYLLPGKYKFYEFLGAVSVCIRNAAGSLSYMWNPYI